MRQKYVFLVLGFLLLGTLVQSQDLTLTVNDLVIEQWLDGGFHLFVKKKPEIRSVLITESTRDPTMTTDQYAYRVQEWNPINGREIRLIDGQPLSSENENIFLISSTVANHPELGEVFHIFIPWLLNYGYENTRHGELYVSDGTYLNIRAFTLPYGDYRGPFKDNPFTLMVNQMAIQVPPGFYMKATEESFKAITQQGGGSLVYSKGAEDLVEKIKSILEKEEGSKIDVVVCLDTTGSMEKKINAVKADLVPMLREIIQGFDNFRIGMVLFKDYYQEYLTRILPFTNDLDRIQRDLNAITTRGGGDIPEAVHEALYDGITRFSWEAENRVMILVGDAPPHPRPKGKITEAMVFEAAAVSNIQISAILLPP
jgi:hypothetical protein